MSDKFKDNLVLAAMYLFYGIVFLFIVFKLSR